MAVDMAAGMVADTVAGKVVDMVVGYSCYNHFDLRFSIPLLDHMAGDTEVPPSIAVLDIYCSAWKFHFESGIDRPTSLIVSTHIGWIALVLRGFRHG